MLLYLRHSDDRGADVYKHDRPLNDRGRKKARKAFVDLVAEHGHPDTLFVSPFRRALQTLDEMAPQFRRPVDVHRDPRVAQYLGGKREPLVSPETSAVVSVEETLDAFRARVRLHAEDARRRERLGSAIWCITHQVVIDEAAAYFEVEVSRDLDFLDSVVMIDSSDLITPGRRS